MAATQRFRAQHDDLLKMAGEIAGKLNATQLAENANDVRMLLSKLLGKLNVHLSVEDKSLYPKLLNHSDPGIKTMAKRFIDEMGAIGQTVGNYNDKWKTASAIQEDPTSFIRETNTIFAALKKRIDKENNVLYKKVDDENLL